jgi:hypothetical protein
MDERNAVVRSEMVGLSASISDLDAELQVAEHRCTFCLDMLRAVDSSEEVSTLVQADAAGIRLELSELHGLVASSGLVQRAEHLRVETMALAERLERLLARTDKAPWEEFEIARVQTAFDQQSEVLAATFHLLQQRQCMELELGEAVALKSQLVSKREAPQLQHDRLAAELEANFYLAQRVAREIAALESDETERASKPWKHRLTCFEREPPTWEARACSGQSISGPPRPISAAPVCRKAATRAPIPALHRSMERPCRKLHHPKAGPPRLLQAAEASSAVQLTPLVAVPHPHGHLKSKVWQVAMPADAIIDSTVDVLCGAERLKVRTWSVRRGLASGSVVPRTCVRCGLANASRS